MLRLYLNHVKTNITIENEEDLPEGFTACPLWGDPDKDAFVHWKAGWKRYYLKEEA